MSLRIPPVDVTASGVPVASRIRWCLEAGRRPGVLTSFGSADTGFQRRNTAVAFSTKDRISGLA